MKLFRTSDIHVVSQCQECVGLDLLTYDFQLARRVENFLHIIFYVKCGINRSMYSHLHDDTRFTYYTTIKLATIASSS